MIRLVKTSTIIMRNIMAGTALDGTACGGFGSDFIFVLPERKMKSDPNLRMSPFCSLRAKIPPDAHAAILALVHSLEQRIAALNLSML